jgi:peptidoglycan/xylan/chitin deacetylase (PgdA/CDA1 family)
MLRKYPTKGFCVALAMAGVVIAVAALLSSCSVPPPRKASAPSTPKTIHRERPEAAARVTETKKPAAPTTSSTPAQATSHPRRRYAGYPGEIAHTASKARIALTFDAGASAAPCPSILKTLRDNGLHVTFFLTGKWCEANPELVKEIAAEGHEICNHTYSHPDLRKITDDEIVEQLSKTEDLVTNLTGQSTKPYFRPPFGGRDKHVLSVAGEQGYTSVYWSLDCLDAYKKGITADQIATRVLDRIQGGDIVLMHCGSAATATALHDLIARLQERGFEIVKVSELNGF